MIYVQGYPKAHWPTALALQASMLKKRISGASLQHDNVRRVVRSTDGLFILRLEEY